MENRRLSVDDTFCDNCTQAGNMFTWLWWSIPEGARPSHVLSDTLVFFSKEASNTQLFLPKIT